MDFSIFVCVFSSGVARFLDASDQQPKWPLLTYYELRDLYLFIYLVIYLYYIIDYIFIYYLLFIYIIDYIFIYFLFFIYLFIL